MKNPWYKEYMVQKCSTVTSREIEKFHFESFEKNILHIFPYTTRLLIFNLFFFKFF